MSQAVVVRLVQVESVTAVRPMPPAAGGPELEVQPVQRPADGAVDSAVEVVRLLAEDDRLDEPDKVSSWSVTIPQGVREVIGRRLGSS